LLPNPSRHELGSQGVPGALLSAGDSHAAQGDSELAGTAIECSLTGTLQLVLHENDTLTGTALAGLEYPLLETQEEWVLHGFSYPTYPQELSANAQSDIYSKSSVDLAMRDAFRKMRHFLMTTRGLSEGEAISLMSVAVDYGITRWWTATGAFTPSSGRPSSPVRGDLRSPSRIADIIRPRQSSCDDGPTYRCLDVRRRCCARPCRHSRHLSTMAARNTGSRLTTSSFGADASFTNLVVKVSTARANRWLSKNRARRAE
jgi:hypothetical protein